MIYTDEVFEIEDCIDNLCQTINNSNVMQKYLEKRKLVQQDKGTKSKEKSFIQAKESFERVESYGKYAPDFTEKRRALRKEKRILDMDENVSSFRICERELQDTLDHISFEVAQVVSSEIKIDAGNPFFEFAQEGCGGSCHVG